MADERQEETAGAPSAVFTEATRLFNLWLEALDATVSQRSRAAGEAAQSATAALLAYLDEHPESDELTPVRERLALVFQRLRAEEPGGAAPVATRPGKVDSPDRTGGDDD